MAVAKIIEITAESPKSFEAAVAEGVQRASKTVNNIQSAWVKDQQVQVDGDKVTTFRVTLKVTFLIG